VGPRQLEVLAQFPVLTVSLTARSWTPADGYPALKAVYRDPVRNDTGHETFAAYLRAHKTLTPAPLDRVTQKG
jgi:5'-nucleotidase